MGVGMGQAAHMGPASLERVRVPVRLFSGRRRSRAARCNVARGRFRRTGLSAALSLLLLSTFGGPATPAFAAAPFPSPSTADQLACDLSPASNAGDFSSWWAAIPANATFAGWLWNDILPNNGGTACRADVAQTFWTRAVPGNWALIGNIGGWPWPAGGYYTQWLWLHAVPDNLASVADIGGWPWPAGGYYTQWLWLHAVRENWAFTGDIGGWPWPTGGYYTQWFWLHTVPDNWASIGNIGGWPFPTGGYYTQWFWQHAVPDNWAVIGNIGGWPFASGGYYTQSFWLHGGPDSWAARPEMAIGGKGGAGYYDYSFYHFATVRDFAWRNALSINGSAGAGYFDYWYHRDFGQNVAHYQRLLGLAGGYLNNASTFTPVSSWFSPVAQAVVALTFDTEGSEAETCAVTKVLNQQGVTGAFYLVGTTADSLTPGWIQCLSGMDIEDHTLHHPGSFDVGPQTWMDTQSDAVQITEIRDNVARVRAKIPNALLTSLRTPDC